MFAQFREKLTNSSPGPHWLSPHPPFRADTPYISKNLKYFSPKRRTSTSEEPHLSWLRIRTSSPLTTDPNLISPDYGSMSFIDRHLSKILVLTLQTLVAWNCMNLVPGAVNQDKTIVHKSFWKIVVLFRTIRNNKMKTLQDSINENRAQHLPIKR